MLKLGPRISYRRRRLMNTSYHLQTICLVIAIFYLTTVCESFVSPPSSHHHLLLTTTRQHDDDGHHTGSNSQKHRIKETPLSSLFLSAVSRKRREGGGGAGGGSIFKGRKKKNSGGKQKNKKWDNRRRNISNASAGKPRPVITRYEEERDAEINEQRLETVGEVKVVRSAARFFSSTAIRKNRLDVERSGEDWVVEDEDDGFYDVVVPTETNQWRTQAKLPAAPLSGGKWAKDGCIFGLYERGTHKVINILTDDVPNYEVHHPSINRALEALTKATEKTGTPAYSDDGGLRYVQLQVERTTGKICLTLVWGTSELKWTQPALSRLMKELTRSEPDLWHSMWCHCNDGPGNNIFSRNTRNWHRLSGPEFVREPLPVGDLGWLYFSPLVFRQGNIDGFDIIANDVARAVPSGSKVCELYAGVGMLGLTSLVFHHQNHEQYRDQIDGYSEPLSWVRCSDENPANIRCFSASLRSLPQEITEHPHQEEKSSMTLGELRKKMEARDEDYQIEAPKRTGPRASYMTASAGVALKAGQALGANILIVDPPRKGLEDDVLDELCKPFNPKQQCVESIDMLTVPDHMVNWVNDVQTLLYVSCGFDALARDCEKLLSSGGGWKLESATGYILFPGSNHVETLCIFHRR